MSRKVAEERKIDELLQQFEALILKNEQEKLSLLQENIACAKKLKEIQGWVEHGLPELDELQEESGEDEDEGGEDEEDQADAGPARDRLD